MEKLFACILEKDDERMKITPGIGVVSVCAQEAYDLIRLHRGSALGLYLGIFCEWYHAHSNSYEKKLGLMMQQTVLCFLAGQKLFIVRVELCANSTRAFLITYHRCQGLQDL